MLLSCSTHMDAKFLGFAPSFIGVDVSGSPDHHEEHHAHSEDHHDHHHDEHQETKHRDHHDNHHDEHSSASAEHDGHHGHPKGVSGASSVAMGLMAFVILTPVVLSMLMTKVAGGQVSYLTFRLVDMATSIFLAVLCFSAFGKTIHSIFPKAAEIVEVALVLVLYIVTLRIAYTLRENKNSLFIFCSCSAHFIAFAAIQAAGEMQDLSGKLVELSIRPHMSFMFCILLFATFAMTSVISFYSWRRHTKSEELNIAVDELELDIAGLVLSFAIMQALRHALSGHYPSPAHFLLQFSLHHGYSGHGHATEAQRAEMLMWSIGFTFLACSSLWLLNKLKDSTHYWMHKFLHVVEVVLVMCAAWGYLLWGVWQFTETDLHGDKMYGNMMFAVIATAISLTIIVVLAFFISGPCSNAKGYARLCIMAFSLLTAWSWEHCFVTAIDIVAEEYQVGYGGLVPKIIIAIVIPLVVLPGYVFFLKPIVLEKQEQFDAEDEETESKDLAEVMNIEPESPRRTGEGATFT